MGSPSPPPCRRRISSERRMHLRLRPPRTAPAAPSPWFFPLLRRITIYWPRRCPFYVPNKGGAGDLRRRGGREQAKGHGARHRARQDLRRRGSHRYHLGASLGRLLQDDRRRGAEVSRGHGRGRCQGVRPLHPEPCRDGQEPLEGDAHHPRVRREAAQDHRPLRQDGCHEDVFMHPVHRGERPFSGGPCGMGRVLRALIRQFVHWRQDQPRRGSRGSGGGHPREDRQLRPPPGCQPQTHEGHRGRHRRLRLLVLPAGTGRRDDNGQRDTLFQGDLPRSGGGQDPERGHGRGGIRGALAR